MTNLLNIRENSPIYAIARRQFHALCVKLTPPESLIEPQKLSCQFVDPVAFRPEITRQSPGSPSHPDTVKVTVRL